SESEDSKGKVSDTESGEGEDSESPEQGDINEETREEAPLKSYDVRNVLLILVAVAAVIVMAVSAFALFQNPLVRVLAASRKTIMDNDIMKALDPMEIISDGSFSSNFSFSASSTGVSFGADYSQDGKKKQQSFAATANVGLARVELQEYFDREQVLLFMPGVTGNSYSYDYRNGKLGDLAGRLGLTEEKEEALADILSVVADGKWQRSRSFISPGGTVGKWFTGLDYEKADPAECEVNGKKRNCKGYSVRVESEDMERLLDLLAKERKSDRRRIRDDLETLGFSESAVCSAGRKIADTVTGGQFTFYIWRGQLAQFVCELNNTSAVISFKGGNYPAQNVDADVNGRSVAIRGVTDGNVEEISVLLDGDNAGTVKYDRSAGDMDIVTADRGMYLRIENDGKKWKLSTDDPLLIGGAPLTGSLTFEKDPKIIKPGTEKVVDITELNNEALSRIGESLFELLK
ncbi:MAG: hypothetical protein K6E33_06160, partial [Lachnospiraceae bacterium]|nr:hypothetical protein [Lachnospiraceae bacterium]